MTVRTKQVWDAILKNEKYYNKMEYAYAKRLIKWSKSANTPFNHIHYLEHLQSLKLSKQKSEVTFLVKIFECVGLSLNQFELRHFQNENKGQRTRPAIRKKAALASDAEIQDTNLIVFSFLF